MTHSLYYYNKTLGNNDSYHYFVEHDLEEKEYYNRASMDQADTIWWEDETGVYVVHRIYQPNKWHPNGKSVIDFDYKPATLEDLRNFTWTKLFSVKLRKGEFLK